MIDMTVYQMLLNNVSRELSSDRSEEDRGFDAFVASSVLGAALCMDQRDVLSDLAQVGNRPTREACDLSDEKQEQKSRGNFTMPDGTEVKWKEDVNLSSLLGECSICGNRPYRAPSDLLFLDDGLVPLLPGGSEEDELRPVSDKAHSSTVPGGIRLHFEGVSSSLLRRIDDSGFISLTMSDIRAGVTFEDADLNDIRGTRLVSYSARKIQLSAGDQTRILKDRTEG